MLNCIETAGDKWRGQPGAEVDRVVDNTIAHVPNCAIPVVPAVGPNVSRRCDRLRGLVGDGAKGGIALSMAACSRREPLISRVGGTTRTTVLVDRNALTSNVSRGNGR